MRRNAPFSFKSFNQANELGFDGENNKKAKNKEQIICVAL